MLLKTLVRLSLVVAVLVALVVPAAAQTDGTLRVGMNAPVNLDPALNSNDPETALNYAIYDLLIDVQPDNALTPNLATEWTISDDNLTYTLTLAEGVTFHDGSPFSSADVVFTFNRLKEVGSPALGLLGDFEVSAPDAQTVVFTLAEVNADFLYGVASRWAFILKDGTTEPNVLVDGDTPYANFNGTGAFRLDTYSAEDRAVFVRNDAYWKADQPQLAMLEFVFLSDPVAQVDALLSGDIDFIFKIPATQIDRLTGDSNVTVYEVPTAQHAVIRLRTDEEPGSNIAVRQALKYATDRQLLLDIAAGGRGVVANNDPISPVYGAFYSDTIENQTYDPVRACELIAEAGYTEGLQFTLFVPNAFEYPDLATVLQQQWQETGCITVDIQVRDEGLYYDVSNPENYFDVQLGMTGWGARPVAQQYLEEAYTSDAPYNESRWADPELDELVAQARTTTDEAARAEIYAQISQVFAERGPIIIPYFPIGLAASRANVTGLDVAPYFGLTDYRTVSISG